MSHDSSKFFSRPFVHGFGGLSHVSTCLFEKSDPRMLVVCSMSTWFFGCGSWHSDTDGLDSLHHRSSETSGGPPTGEVYPTAIGGKNAPKVSRP